MRHVSRIDVMSRDGQRHVEGRSLGSADPSGVGGCCCLDYSRHSGMKICVQDDKGKWGCTMSSGDSAWPIDTRNPEALAPGPHRKEICMSNSAEKDWLLGWGAQRTHSEMTMINSLKKAVWSNRAPTIPFESSCHPTMPVSK